MNKTIKRISVSLFIALFLLSISFIKSSTNGLGTVQAASYEWGTVKVDSWDRLNVRTAGTASAKIILRLKTGTRVKIAPSTLKKTWVKITVSGKTGYACGKYIETAYGTATEPYKYIRAGITNVKTYVYSAAKTTSKKLITIPKNSTIQVLSKGNNVWPKVKYSGKTGYTKGVKINIKNTTKTAAGTAIPTTTTTPAPTPVTTPTTTNKGQAIIDYAKLFLGNPYVYGGNSLTNGTDCSGFVHLIYAHFGYNITRQSYALRSDGVAVSGLANAQPGDIICYDGHVALYMGNGQIIHASNERDGIKISPNAAYRTIVAIRRIVK